MNEIIREFDWLVVDDLVIDELTGDLHPNLLDEMQDQLINIVWTELRIEFGIELTNNLKRV
jgi:hypothetical protein